MNYYVNQLHHCAPAIFYLINIKTKFNPTNESPIIRTEKFLLHTNLVSRVALLHVSAPLPPSVFSVAPCGKFCGVCGEGDS